MTCLFVACATREVAFDPSDYPSSSDAGSAPHDGGRSDGGSRRDGGNEADGGGVSDGGSTCDPACGATSRCVNGQCILITCVAPETKCGSQCVNTSTDPAHCGSCTRVCPGTSSAEASCENGACVIHCAADPEGQVCPSSSFCMSGHCCPAGQTWCTDHCVDTETELANCGACNHPCEAPAHGSATCSGGSCRFTCGGNYSSCGSECVDLQSDSNHCGTCAHSCSGGACSGGACTIGFATCTISASSGWQTCNGLSVTSGDTLVFGAAGHWVWSPSWDSPGCDAPGESTNPVPLVDYRYSTGWNYGSLLWAIENDNLAGAFDGASWDSSRNQWVMASTAPATGRILFRINDEEGKTYDNTGSMSVRVDVSR